jgi:hypothetical protein
VIHRVARHVGRSRSWIRQGIPGALTKTQTTPGRYKEGLRDLSNPMAQRPRRRDLNRASSRDSDLSQHLPTNAAAELKQRSPAQVARRPEAVDAARGDDNSNAVPAIR